MATRSLNLKDWADARVQRQEIDPYLNADGSDFVDDEALKASLRSAAAPSDARLQALLDKSLGLSDLSLAETAELLAVTDPGQRRRMDAAALAVKKKAFGNCVSAFAPLYLGNACVNGCSYCGFKSADCSNGTRRILNEAEISAEVEVLAGQLGHRRLLAVVGEHPSSGVKYITDALSAIYAAQAPQSTRFSEIRCVSLNAPPMSVADLRSVREAGVGSYLVFQGTYDHAAYQKAHPSGPKSDYRWRLYAQHRAMEAGIGHVGLGVLLGLADWRFETLALVQHAHALEASFGMGPSSITLQRLDPGMPGAEAAHAADDAQMLHMVAALRLALPCAGLVVSASEGAELRKRALQLGVTQTDASASIGVGAYHEGGVIPASACRQFAVGDPASLDDLVVELGASGSLTSFCSPGFRGDLSGKDYMASLRSGEQALVCSLNAMLTFQEWIDDFADPSARALGEALLEKEAGALALEHPELKGALQERLQRTRDGERGLYF